MKECYGGMLWGMLWAMEGVLIREGVHGMCIYVRHRN